MDDADVLDRAPLIDVPPYFPEHRLVAADDPLLRGFAKRREGVVDGEFRPAESEAVQLVELAAVLRIHRGAEQKVRCAHEQRCREYDDQDLRHAGPAGRHPRIVRFLPLFSVYEGLLATGTGRSA